jgi:LCP family protein required for cell wall assembly
MTQIERTQPKSKGVSLAKGLQIALLVAFLIAALLTAYLTFMAVRSLIASWQMTSLPGVSIQEATPTPGPNGETPVANSSISLQPVVGPTPPPWDGASRVSLLVMGLDYREWAAGEGPPHTDTMILFTIDPVNRTAGMLSIPRDLWVNIPGFGYGRINTAFPDGEGAKLPGGGPKLAADTVEQLLGVPVDYYAQIDFGAFVRFIDEIGGVKVNITEAIKVDPLSKGSSKILRPGVQVLSGDLALAYVRVRKTEGGDFDRAQRQQDVILAIRDRILKFNMLPTLIAKAPVLFNELSSGIHTNLTLDQTIRLAWTAAQIPTDQIKHGAIGAQQVSFATSPDGQMQVLKPITEKIRELRDEVFSASDPIKPAATNMDTAELVKQEGARVAVLNGSSTSGIAARTTDYLKSQGVNVTQTGNAERLAPYTEITFNAGKPYTIKFLVDLMKISPLRIRFFYDPASQVDITIVVGEDWAKNNTMP